MRADYSDLPQGLSGEQLKHHLAEAERERSGVNNDAILAAVKGKAPAEVSQSAEFKIEPTVIQPYYNGSKVQITRVRVTVRRYAVDDREDDGTGYAYVEGYGVTLTQKGAPSKSASPFWYSLSDDLAAQLLLQAHTHSTDRRED